MTTCIGHVRLIQNTHRCTVSLGDFPRNAFVTPREQSCARQTWTSTPRHRLYSTAQGIAPQGEPAPAYYILFVTHHLLAASKQSDLRAWCKELGLVGFAKRGYPGVILLAAANTGLAKRDSHSGDEHEQFTQELRQQEHVGRLIEVGRRIKSLRWASQDLRPLQPLLFDDFASLWRALSQRLDLNSDLGSRIEANARDAAHLSARMTSRLLFVDSMKEVSELLRTADATRSAPHGDLVGKGGQDSQPRDKKKGRRRQRHASPGGDNTGHDSSIQTSDKGWMNIWRNEMGPS